MSLMQQSKKPYDLFYCYADEDEALLNKLEIHLSSLKRDGLIRSWSKQGISPGANWQHELNNQISRASIILLLVSSNFTHSDHVYNFEIERVVNKRQTKEAIIIPVLVRSCDWKEVKFGEHEKLSDYEVLPQNRKPVTRWPNRDDAFTEIALAVRQAVTNLREYAEERRMGIVNPKPKSIYPRSNTARPQHISLLEDLQPNPVHKTGMSVTHSTGSQRVNKVSTNPTKVDTPIRNTGRSAKPDKRGYAQFVGKSVAEPSWGKKTIPKKRRFSQLREKYFTFDDISKYDTGIRWTLFFFFLAVDVGGFTLVSRYLLGAQEQVVAVCIFSSLFFLWGVFNKNGFVALILTTLFSGIWAIIGFHYLPLYPASIPVTVIALCFVLALLRFLLFREYKQKKRRSLSRSR
ncbi:MAG TPA: toll/interleukin-1 receptor domain-containing protein [Ktedonobacteraceae bacterium]|nr:toll/interleukin-1 receptor domain-containing protein [Ktedonobacteraceae bacterium]